MRRLLLSAALVGALTVAASAQTIVVKRDEQSMVPATIDPVRVSVGVNMFVPSPGDGSDAALKAQEDARRAIYELAGRECAILRDVLASDCRLDSVNVNVQRVAPNVSFGQQKTEGFNVNGNIGFRVAPK